MTSQKQNGRVIWGEICIKTVRTSNEFVLSDSCGRFREGTYIKDTNSSTPLKPTKGVNPFSVAFSPLHWWIYATTENT